MHCNLGSLCIHACTCMWVGVKPQTFTKNVDRISCCCWFFILFVPSFGFIFNFYQMNPFFPIANNWQSLHRGEIMYQPSLSKLEFGPDLPGFCACWYKHCEFILELPCCIQMFPCRHPSPLTLILSTPSSSMSLKVGDEWGEREVGRAIDSLQRWAFFGLILCTFANCGLCAKHCYKYKLLRWRLTDALIYN